MQHIYIIGAGAIGKVLAVFLTLAGKQVTLLRGSVDDGTSHTETMQVVLEDGHILEATVEVSTLSNFNVLDGIIVLTNKSYGNPNLATALKGKTAQSPVVILQNGLGVEQPFVSNGFPTYRCVLFVTSQAIANNQTRFKPVSVCPIGAINGNDGMLNTIVENLSTQYFSFRSEANIQTITWKKAIINCVFNSVCPLLDIDNGVFHRNESAMAIAKRVIAECLTVAAKQGVTLQQQEVEEGLLAISRMSDGQAISTLQDIRNKRETEIDTLNFAIAQMAKEDGMDVIETNLLGQLTKLKSILHR